ncbi:MAG: hypothetical protein ACI9N1_000304 [Flavobacteriales bacterium]|jgi:hypothetical protein
MSKINIHRDQPQPSDEQLLQHKNFDAVLHGAKVSYLSTKSATKSIWSNPFIWAAGLIVITGAILVWNMNSESIVPTHLEDKNKLISTPLENSSETVIPMDTITTDYKEDQLEVLLSENEVEIQTNIKKEIDASKVLKSKNSDLTLSQPDGPVFKLSTDFKLIENFEEFESFDQVRFQPLEKINPTYLETAWDSAFLIKDETEYRLRLHKNNNEKMFRVKPTL